MKKFIILFLFSIYCHASEQFDHEKVFTDIYNKGKWGRDAEGRGTSGSIYSNKDKYIAVVQECIRTYDIKTVFDAGCGDWAVSKYIDWSHVNYTGMDVVASVIKRNQEIYSAPNISFVHDNFLETDLPQADLFLCRLVLQHLSNKDILKLIPQLKKFKYCLIINDPLSPEQTCNPELEEPGHSRGLDLSKEPFYLKSKVIYTSFNKCGKNPVWHHAFFIDNTEDE